MACCSFCDHHSVDEWMQNRRIETMLRQERDRLASEIKVLLLGTGESGKSTIMKQMKVIHGGEDSLLGGQPMAQVRHIIYQNMLKGMKVLLCARATFALPWATPDNAKVADFVSKADTKNLITVEYFRRYCDLLDTLWQDAAIQATFQRRNEFQLVSVRCSIPIEDDRNTLHRRAMASITCSAI